jgi:hypothetical protein
MPPYFTATLRALRFMPIRLLNDQSSSQQLRSGSNEVNNNHEKKVTIVLCSRIGDERLSINSFGKEESQLILAARTLAY